MDNFNTKNQHCDTSLQDKGLEEDFESITSCILLVKAIEPSLPTFVLSGSLGLSTPLFAKRLI